MEQTALPKFQEYVNENADYLSEFHNQTLLQLYLQESLINEPLVPKIVKQIIQKGVDIHHQDWCGMTALHYAAKKKSDLEVFKILC